MHLGGFIVRIYHDAQSPERRIRHICPFIHMDQLVSHWKNFQKISYLSILQKSVVKIQV